MMQGTKRRVFSALFFSTSEEKIDRWAVGVLPLFFFSTRKLELFFLPIHHWAGRRSDHLINRQSLS